MEITKLYVINISDAYVPEYWQVDGGIYTNFEELGAVKWQFLVEEEETYYRYIDMYRAGMEEKHLYRSFDENLLKRLR